MTFFVPGIPKPKGSWKAFVVGGRAVLVPDNAKVKAWQKAVRVAALESVISDHAEPSSEPMSVDIEFCLPRPKSVKRELPSVKPDIDKLIRCVLDGLEGVAFDNDSRVVRVTARKRYGIEPGAYIEVRPI